MAKIKLTVAGINSAKPKAHSYWLDDADAKRGKGSLSIKVQPSGSKAYFFSYYPGKARRSIKLGDVPRRAGLPGMSLAEANDKARVYGDLWSNGTDPKEHLERSRSEAAEKAKEEAKRGSLDQLFVSYTESMKANGKRTYETVLREMRKEAGAVLDLSIKAKEVKTQDIVEILGRMIDRGAEVQSNRVRAMLHAAFQYGLHHDNDPKHNRHGQLFGLPFNPVSNVPKQRSAEKTLDRNLSGHELSRLLNDLDNQAFFTPSMRAYLLTMIYTGQRVQEVTRLRWEDLDLQKGLWEMDPERSKVGMRNLIPLCDDLVLVLKELKLVSEHGPLVFAARRKPESHVGYGAISLALRRYFVRADKAAETRAKAKGEAVADVDRWVPFTARDLRRTFKTRLGDLGVSKHVRDLIQSHVTGDTSSKHYDRAEYLSEKAEAMDVWEQALRKWRTNPNWDPINREKKAAR